MFQVFGSSLSYYTGKVEAYLRFRSIDYQLLPMAPHARELLKGAGVVQAPVVKMDDGRWMTDSTPMLAWLESRERAPSIYPESRVLRFVALFLEDYADEWLWRSAMHYRWSYQQDRESASGVLADEMLSNRRGPRLIKRMIVARRQRNGFVRCDGVSDATQSHVEQGYLTPLDLLQKILSERRFLLGDSPTIADFGFVGPMFRHFGQDPTPAEIMRTRAPAVFEWVARMWNLRPEEGAPRLLKEVDELVVALLAEACETHLVQSRENAVAYGRQQSHFSVEIQGCQYTRLPTSRYRVWCLEELRREWQELEQAERELVASLLPEADASILWDDSIGADSEYDLERRAPFNRAINVYGTGVPT